MRIYLAGPLFTTAERNFNSDLCEGFRRKNFDVFLPQEHEQRDSTAANIFDADREGIVNSNIIVANMDGSDPDSGTCWEVGFAIGVGKYVVLYRTDIREEQPFGPYNLMLHQSAQKVLDCRWLSVNQIVDKIVKELTE